MKKFVMLMVCLIMFTGFVSAQEFESTGKLNVITDMDDTVIFIDGTEVGRSYIKNHEVSAGSHYIVVRRNGKKIYADTIYIYSGEVVTIPTAHFVDIKTSTPNRGALEVEAARIKETRGSGAFGLYAGTPAAGLSFKYWFMEPFGIQIVGYAQGNSDLQESQAGGRLLYSLGTKILFEQAMEAYWAVGLGNKIHDDKTDADDDYTGSTAEFALGLEFGIGNIFFSVETGFESVTVNSTATSNMKLAGGIHYYF